MRSIPEMAIGRPGTMFADMFSDERIVATLSQQLSGPYVVEVLPPRELLAQRLQQATARAQQHIEHRAPAARPEHK